MKDQVKRRIAGKSIKKPSTPTARVKSIGRVTAQQSTNSGRKVATQRSRIPGAQQKNDFIFSYNHSDDSNVLAIIDAIRTGISFDKFQRITSRIPFSSAEWAHYLQLSERTLQRTQKEKKSFQPIHSERIIELLMLYEYGVQVFGDQENFDVWLKSNSIALGGRTPKELLDTRFGVSMVKDELGRIEHGILA